MNQTLALILASLVLASADGHCNPLPMVEAAGPGASVEALPETARPATFPGREALRAQLRASVPVVRELAAAVGGEIAARALTAAAASAAPSQSLLSKSH